MSRRFCFHSPDSPEILREKLEQWITAERWRGARQALSDGRWSCRVRWRRKGRFTLKEKHWRAGETGIYTFSKPYWRRTDAHRPITPAEKMPRPFGEQRTHVVGGFHIGTHAEAYFPRPFSGRIRPDGEHAARGHPGERAVRVLPPAEALAAGERGRKIERRGPGRQALSSPRPS